MVKQAVKLTVGSGADIHTFWFKTITDCNAFKYVFKDHWCNINWNPIEIVTDPYSIPNERYTHWDDDPKKRADDLLTWGFSWVKAHGGDNLTHEQQRFVNDMVTKLISAPEKESASSTSDIDGMSAIDMQLNHYDVEGWPYGEEIRSQKELDLTKENEALKAENLALKNQLQTVNDHLRAENEQLKKHLDGLVALYNSYGNPK